MVRWTVRGTVVNQAARPIANAQVMLRASGKTAVTDSNGIFNITLSTVDLLPADHRTTLRRIRCDGKRVDIMLDRRPQQVSIDVFNAVGARVAGIPGQLLPVGEHRLSIVKLMGGSPALSFRLVVVTVGGVSYHFSFIDGAGSSISSPLLEGIHQRHHASMARQLGTAALYDTMVIVKDSSVQTNFLVGVERDADLHIPVDAIPYEVVRFAVAEVGRYPDEVGKDIGFSPYNLARYLDKTGDGPHDYEAWCSEFASWVYCVGGFPLTGGSQGGWMISGSTQLRSWFQRYAQFVDRNHPQWETFVPIAGDYVRYDNSSGGHSGIVRYAHLAYIYETELCS